MDILNDLALTILILAGVLLFIRLVVSRVMPDSFNSSCQGG